jgi:hypothetical protein
MKIKDPLELKSRDTFATAMAEQGISVRALATLVGRTKSSISRLNSGAQAQCDAVVARRIEQVLNVRPGELFVVPVVSIVHCETCGQRTAA